MANKKKGQDDERQFQGQIRAGVLFPVASSGNQMPDDYRSLLAELKERIVSERLRITFAANAAMIMLYWDIGRTILRRQKHEGWGAKVIDRLSADLHDAFPDMQGLSPRNLKYMRKFAEAWPVREFVQQTAAQIPWFHNCLLLDKMQDAPTRQWYIKATIENGWSRSILALQIDAQAHRRHGKAVSNFNCLYYVFHDDDKDLSGSCFAKDGSLERHSKRDELFLTANFSRRLYITKGLRRYPHPPLSHQGKWALNRHGVLLQAPPVLTLSLIHI